MSTHTEHDFTKAKAVTVDSIEGEYARVELPDGTTEDWRLDAMPEGVKEGDVVYVRAAEGQFEMRIDHEETRERRQQAQSKLDTLNAESSTDTGEINL